MDIRYCARLMSAFNLTRVLVETDNEIIGTVSPSALVLDGLAEIVTDE